MPGFYSPAVFDPALIVGQIAAMQSLIYIGLGSWLLLLNALAGQPATAVSLAQIFSHRAINLSHTGGWLCSLAFFLNALAGGAFLAIVVERARSCLDFATTVHALHLCGCALYDGFPDNWEWWMVNFVSLVVMALLGEYLCMKREMQDIPLLFGSRERSRDRRSDFT